MVMVVLLQVYTCTKHVWSLPSTLRCGMPSELLTAKHQQQCLSNLAVKLHNSLIALPCLSCALLLQLLAGQNPMTIVALNSQADLDNLTKTGSTLVANEAAFESAWQCVIKHVLCVC